MFFSWRTFGQERNRQAGIEKAVLGSQGRGSLGDWFWLAKAQKESVIAMWVRSWRVNAKVIGLRRNDHVCGWRGKNHLAINLVGNFTGKLKSIHCLFLKDDCCPKTFVFGQSWRKGLCSPVQACKACCNSIAGLLYIALFQACAVSHGQRALNMHPPWKKDQIVKMEKGECGNRWGINSKKTGAVPV